MNPIPIHRIIRSKRKTISLVITPDAKLIVHAPFRVSGDSIQKLVREKSGWISRKITELAKKPVSSPKKFTESEEFLFLGNRYPLCIRKVRSCPVELREKLYVPARSAPALATLVSAWYRAEAKKFFSGRCDALAKVTGCTPKTLRLSSAQKRWGSCSTSGTVSLNWRLILAPPEIIDYVILHELIHLRHHNHSKKFWDAVGSFMPDYPGRRDWLKFHEKTLALSLDPETGRT
jgi:predicted metal-dependent hydrolase